MIAFKPQMSITEILELNLNAIILLEHYGIVKSDDYSVGKCAIEKNISIVNLIVDLEKW